MLQDTAPIGEQVASREEDEEEALQHILSEPWVSWPSEQDSNPCKESGPAPTWKYLSIMTSKQVNAFKEKRSGSQAKAACTSVIKMTPLAVKQRPRLPQWMAHICQHPACNSAHKRRRKSNCWPEATMHGRTKAAMQVRTPRQTVSQPSNSQECVPQECPTRVD